MEGQQETGQETSIPPELGPVNGEKTGHYIDRAGLGEETTPETSPVKGEQTGHYLDRAGTGEGQTPKDKRQDEGDPTITKGEQT